MKCKYQRMSKQILKKIEGRLAKLKGEMTDKMNEEIESEENQKHIDSVASELEEEEFNLSENCKGSLNENVYLEEDVKEFIRRLKEKLDLCSEINNHEACFEIIDKLAGDKLI